MDIQTIYKLLSNAGMTIKGVDPTNTYLIIENPNCIVRSFLKFMEYAWIFILLITAFLLMGWAVSIIRGTKTSAMTNIRNLLIILGTISAAMPVINTVYGDDMAASICKNMQVPLAEVQKILDQKNAKLSQDRDLYEDIDIYFDNSAIYDTPNPSDMEPIDVPFGDNPLVETGDSENPIDYAYKDKPQQPYSDQPQPVQTQSTPQTSQTTSQPETPSTPPIPTDDKNLPTHAGPTNGSGVIYTFSDGRTRTHTQGTCAWRNTNPGNIRKTSNQIGMAGGFGIYPSEEHGIQAIIRLLRSDSYRNLNISKAMHRYAPASDGNNPVQYANTLSQQTGISLDKTLGSLTDSEIRKIALEIKRVEGWKPGKVM